MYTSNIEILGQLIPTNACLVVNSHRCGKPNCKCNHGYFHHATSLKYRMNGKQKMRYVKKSDVERVKKQLYQAKGIEILERADKYIFSIASMYPELSGAEIHIRSYEVFGRRRLSVD